MDERPIGLCIIDRETGEHASHVIFTQGDLELFGYVEAVEKMYEGTKWFTTRIYCAKSPITQE